MEKMYAKIPQQVVIWLGIILICGSGCTKQPRNLPATIEQTSKGYRVKMAEFTVIFPSDWGGSIAPGVNQTQGKLARQEIHAFNSRIYIKIRYYNTNYGWASYNRWVRDYQRIYRGENCTIKKSRVGKKYAATIFIISRPGGRLSFTILVDGHGSVVVVNGSASSEDDLMRVIEIINSLDINRDG